MSRSFRQNIRSRNLSYIAAVFCGGLVRNIFSYFEYLPPDFESAFAGFLVDELLVILFATPSFVTSILVSDKIGRKGPLFYVVFGSVSGMTLSLIGNKVLGGHPWETFWEAFARDGPSETIAGAVGGLVQWAVSER